MNDDAEDARRTGKLCLSGSCTFTNLIPHDGPSVTRSTRKHLYTTYVVRHRRRRTWLVGIIAKARGGPVAKKWDPIWGPRHRALVIDTAECLAARFGKLEPEL